MKKFEITPKEKALELTNSFLAYVDWNDIQSDATNRAWAGRNAKKCALIAVDEIINANPILPLQFMLESEAIDAAIEYWQEVKQEIEKL